MKSAGALSLGDRGMIKGEKMELREEEDEASRGMS